MNAFAMISISLALLTSCFIQGSESLSGNFPGYREMCSKAASDPQYFSQFRSLSPYSTIVEFYEPWLRFEDHVAQLSPDVLDKLDLLRKLDAYGNPWVQDSGRIGRFSATALRYITVADHIRRLFQLPDNPSIVEIGGGFGGQCYICSHLLPFSNYYIYDLPEVNALIEKMLKVLSVDHVTCLEEHIPAPMDMFDLCISNYAFCECDLDTQMLYFEKLIKRSKKGYMIYNELGRHTFGTRSLSVEEMVELLQSHGLHPTIYPELIQTYPTNVLIVWDADASITQNP